MSLRCRDKWTWSALLVVVICGGCERERREYYAAPSGQNPRPALTDFQPGGSPMGISEIGAHFEANAYHINQGSRWYRAFNCNGCHGAGGGAIGPALMDAPWRYGGNIDQIHASIIDGRPNGMPAWRNRLTDEQAWQLAAYVRALAGNVSKAAAPSRRDALSATPPLNQLPRQPPKGGDAVTVPPQ
ncbi:MAG TPA: c-type cytochrome [Stenotrophomonas sp.]|jgi:cytochrome c oxidase cbb3-type subunit 3